MNKYHSSHGTIADAPKNGHSGMPLDEENKRQLESLKHDSERHIVGDELSTFLKRVSDDIEGIDREKRMSLFRMQLKAHKYFDGNFFGYVDQNCEWRDVQREDGEVWYSDNDLYQNLRTALMELSRTQTEVIITSDSQSEEMQNVAKFAKARYDANRDRTFTAKLKQTENSYALLNGITFRYTYPQFDFKGSRQERVPKLAKREKSGSTAEKTKLCANCARPVQSDTDLKDILGAEYVEEQKPKCQCGSDVFTEVEGFGEDSDVVIGYDDVARCQNAWIVPNPIGIIVSMQASDVTETAFIKWKQIILRSVLEEKFKGVNLPSTGTESVELRYITNQQASTPGEGFSDMEGGSGNTGDQIDSKNELETLEFHQIWLDYSVYCKKKFDQDMPLSNGKTLKAGQPLGSMFPDGLYYAKVGDVILDMWNEDKNRKWTSSPYGLRPGSMYGSGISIALADQELVNDMTRLKMANAWSNGVPREFVDPSIIPELSADPAIPTKVVANPSGQKIVGHAYDLAPATTLSAEVYAIIDTAKSSMQNKIGAMSGTGAGGLQDSQKWGDTATAISIKRDLAVGRFAPDLQLMADQLDRQQAYQFLENEQELNTPAQWEEIKGEYGDETLKLFLKCDLRRELNVTIQPGSYMPKSDAQVQSKLMAVAQILPAMLEAQNPELVAHAFEVFGLPERLGGWNADRAHADHVVRKFRTLCDQFIQQFGDIPTISLEDPQVLAAVQLVQKYANMPVDVFLDNHQALTEAYRDIRSTDEGRDWSNLLTATVSQRVLEHKAGVVKQEAMMNRMAIEAQQPMREAQEAEEAKMLEANNVAAEEARAAEAEGAEIQAMDRMTEFNDRDEARNADLAKQTAQHEHEKDLKAAEILASEQAPEPTKKPGSN